MTDQIYCFVYLLTYMQLVQQLHFLHKPEMGRGRLHMLGLQYEQWPALGGPRRVRYDCKRTVYRPHTVRTGTTILVAAISIEAKARTHSLMLSSHYL